MSTISPWLPRNAIVAAAHALKMRETIAEWSARWLGHGSAVLAGMEAVAANPRTPGIALEFDEGLVIVMPGDASELIGRLMFGVPDGEPTTADVEAISAAAEHALSDLRQRLAELLGFSRDAAWRERDGAYGPGHLFSVRLGQAMQPLLVLVADTLLVRVLKARMRPDPPAEPLGSIVRGLGPQHVTVSALLGTCRLTMGDLQGLSKDDVVVLDRRLDEAVPLVVDRTAQAAGCRVVAGVHHLDLTLA